MMSAFRLYISIAFYACVIQVTKKDTAHNYIFGKNSEVVKRA